MTASKAFALAFHSFRGVFLAHGDAESYVRVSAKMVACNRRHLGRAKRTTIMSNLSATLGTENVDSAPILSAMELELSRSMRGLRVPGSPPPYYMLYALRRTESSVLCAAHGSLLKRRSSVIPQLYVELRVGNHRFDNVVDGGLDDQAEDRESADWVDAPDDLDPTALRIALWKLSQIKFDEALQDYYEHKKMLVSEFVRDAKESFTREAPVVHLEDFSAEPLISDDVAPRLTDISKKFLDHPEIFDPAVELRVDRQKRWLVSSDGTRVVTEDYYVNFSVQAWILSPDGVYLEASRHFRRRVAEIPEKERMESLVDAVIAELKELAVAETLGSFVGPALLSGQAASTMFHEALGHRLEGERLVARGETRTFANKLGERILPKGFHVFDDPTLKNEKGEPWWGSYRVDDQGVLAQRAELVRDGLLCGYLRSRTPSLDGGPSNGHARHDGLQRPMARMANLVVEYEDRSSKSWEDLERELIELARSQGRPHALTIRWIRAGETSTNSYDFQVFKGELAHVEIIDVQTGERRRLQDVELIGTPLSALQRIRSAGGASAMDEGYCYAESGSVPVAGAAPALLLTEVELQQRSTTGHHDPLLPPPFADDGSQGRKAGLRERGQRERLE